MAHGGQGQDILGIQVVNQDSGIVVAFHVPHQEPQAEREGSCFLWQPTAQPQVRFCSQFVGAQGGGRRNRDGKNLEREGNFFYECYSRAADNRSPILAHILYFPIAT